MVLFNQIMDWVVNNLPSTSMAAAIVLELAFRLFPTAKPWSILLIVKTVCTKLGEAFGVIAGWLDKVIPQNVK
jgi:hypothetical protein